MSQIGKLVRGVKNALPYVVKSSGGEGGGGQGGHQCRALPVVSARAWLLAILLWGGERERGRESSRKGKLRNYDVR